MGPPGLRLASLHSGTGELTLHVNRFKKEVLRGDNVIEHPL